VHPHVLISHIHRFYGLGPFFVLDVWPVVPIKILVIADPELAVQVAQTRSLDKHPIVIEAIQHVVGTKSMLVASGNTWKRMHNIFNPGFSSSHLMNVLTSVIVDEGLIFCGKLLRFAETGKLVHLEEVTTGLTVDVIGRVVLDMHFHAQTGKNEFVEALRASASWTRSYSVFNPFANMNPIRLVMAWWYARKMNRYLEKVLIERFASRKQGISTHKQRRKHIIDLALEEHIKENNGEPVDIRAIDDSFKWMAIDNIKTFIFAGHETTSSTICYIFYLLNQHPEHMAEVRKEHDEVFGVEVELAAERIKQSPYLLNKLTYSTAVIKEVLRLYPVATTNRKGDANIPITADGITYSTESFLVMISSHTISRRADIYPNPDAFQPQRFVSGEPVKDAWRPFERGPRSCIGRELAMSEMKIIMVLVARKFDVVSGYGERDRFAKSKGPDTAYGDRAYQIPVVTAKPSDGMPVFVKKVARKV
jgi:cytochrome P450